MGRVKHPKGGKDWAQYTIVVEKELIEQFRAAVKARKEVASQVLTRSLRAYVRESEKKMARGKSQAES
jgi:hypothetical protein